MDNRDKAIQLIKMKGPIVPANISKELGKNILFTSVILADLVKAKYLRMTHFRIGSSPLYYLPGQETRLESFSKYLNQKDQRTFDLLRQKKVLREQEQDPLIRVSLAEIKDFARPLKVTIKGQEETFWKWHSLTNEEAEPIIRDMLSPKTPIPEEKRPIETPEEEQPKKPKEEKIPIETPEEEQPKKPKEEKPQKAKPIQTKPKEEPREGQSTLTHKKIEEEPNDPFYTSVKSYLEKRKARIISKEIIKKEKEIDLVIVIASDVGDLHYFCRAKDKKRIADPDLASAYVAAQMRKLPLLFLSTGDLTKKATEMLSAEFASVTVAKM